MNGYLLTNIKKIDNFSIPDVPKEIIHEKELGEKWKLITWGDTCGDIHVSYKENKSILILNGYITKASFIYDFSSQQNVTECIHENIEKDEKLLIDELLNIGGSFSFLYTDIIAGKSILISDRIASRQLWYKNINNNSYIFSSHPTAIAISQKKSSYNFGAIVSLLLYNTQIDPSISIYNDIYAVKEGSVYTLFNKLHLTKYYTYKHNPENSLSMKEWTNIVADRCQSAVERLSKTVNNPVVFLSGGLDSRLTVSALRSIGLKPILITLADSENLEVQIARKVAKSLDCEHEVIIRDRYWYMNSLKKTIFETGGCFNWIHGHFSKAYKIIQNKYNVDCALLGDFNEAFNKLLCSVDINDKKIWDEKEFFSKFDQLHTLNYRPQNKPRTQKLLSKDIIDIANNNYEEIVVTIFNKVRNISSDKKIIVDFLLRWMSASCISTNFMHIDIQSVGRERVLMFDPDIYDLLEILPSNIRDEKNLGAHVIKKIWPPAAKVINNNTLLPITTPLIFQRMAKIAKPKIGMIRRMIIRDKYKTTAAWPFFAYLFTDKKWQIKFEEILLEKSNYPAEIFNYKEILNCWNDFKNGNISRHKDISVLIEIGYIHKLLNCQ